MDSKDQQLQKVAELLCESIEGKAFLSQLSSGQRHVSDLKIWLQQHYPSESLSFTNNISDGEVDKLVNIANANVVVIGTKPKQVRLVMLFFLGGIALVSIVSVALIVGINRQSDQKILSFSSPEGSICKFKGEYPENWTYKVSNNPISHEILVFFPNEESQKETKAKLIVQCSKPQDILSLSEYVNKIIERRKNTLAQLSIREVKETIFLNREARQLIYSTKDGDQSWMLQEILVLDKGIAYQVIYRADTRHYQKYSSVVTQMMQSFKILHD